MVQLLIWSTAEADGVFMHLKSIGVKVDLDDCCLAKGIDAIEPLVKQYKEWCQPLVIATIAYAVLKELFKSKEIDEEMIKKVVELYPKDETEKYADAFAEEEDHDFEVSETREDCVKEDLKTAAETIEKDMKELLEQCSLKQGQEQHILHLIISFLSSTFSRFGKERAKCMEFFMEKLQHHIATSCILDNLDTLDRALETLNFEEDDQDLKKEQTLRPQ